MKSCLLLGVFFLFSMNCLASVGTCNNLRIISIEGWSGGLIVYPESVNGGSKKRWKFKLNPDSYRSAADIAKLAFTLNKPVTFNYYGLNDDGETTSVSPACNETALKNWETGAEIISVKVNYN